MWSAVSASKPEPKPRRSARQLAERVAECGTKVTLLNRGFEANVADTGEIVPQLRQTEWRGTESVPFSEAVKAIAGGQVEGFKVVMLGKGLSVRIVSTAGLFGFSRLRTWAEQQGWRKRADELARARLAELLAA